METTAIGLTAITTGWLIQLAHGLRGKKDLHAGFLGLYIIGCVILTVDGLLNNAGLPAFLNLACAALAILILAGIRNAGSHKN